jgi:hypothetical protein
MRDLNEEDDVLPKVLLAHNSQCHGDYQELAKE